MTSVDLVLIAAADQRLQADLRSRLHEVDVSSILVSDLEAARGAVQRNTFAAALVDLDSLEQTAALAFIATLRRQQPLTEVVALIAHASFERAVIAIRQGACDVIVKDRDQLGYIGPRILSLRAQAQSKIERQSLLADSARMNEELFLKLTDSARRIGELRWQLSQRPAAAPVAPSGSKPPQPPGKDKSAGPPSQPPPSAPTPEEIAQILIVEEDGWLSRSLSTMLPKTYVVTTVTSGGSALDTTSGRSFDIALIKEALPDLSGGMLVRNLSAQAPEGMYLLWSPPVGRRPGQVERMDGRTDNNKLVPLLPEFYEAKQLADRLPELFSAQLARRRERKFLADFRSENLDLLRRLADLRKRLKPFEAELGTVGSTTQASSSGNFSPVSAPGSTSGSFPGGRRG
ncbi:MAG: hypothetical protein JNJ46_04055 [Myxococcales bacterium]|nr:hypothetical protein [Myxococcales bacterium]